MVSKMETCFNISSKLQNEVMINNMKEMLLSHCSLCSSFCCFVSLFCSFGVLFVYIFCTFNILIGKLF